MVREAVWKYEKDVSLQYEPHPTDEVSLFWQFEITKRMMITSMSGSLNGRTLRLNWKPQVFLKGDQVRIETDITGKGFSTSFHIECEMNAQCSEDPDDQSDCESPEIHTFIAEIE